MPFTFNPSLAEKPQRASYHLSPSVVQRADEIAKETGAKVDEGIDQALRYAFELDGRPRRKRASKKSEGGGKGAGNKQATTAAG